MKKNSEATYVRLQMAERETLKQIARNAETDEITLRALLYAIAHWQRQSTPVSFTDYASSWSLAHPFPTGQMSKLFPLNGRQMIQPNYSDWGSFGHPGYQLNQNAGHRTRTHTALQPADFKSAASTNFASPAQADGNDSEGGQS